MPKKQPRNAFYFYMLEFKNEQRRAGINYANLAEVATAADEPWKNLHPSQRAKYEAKAKEARLGPNRQERKYTSTGVPVDVIQQQDKEKLQAERDEEDDINKLVQFNMNIKNEYFYIMDVNVYCNTNTLFLIGEFTLLRFNLKDGVKHCYHELINPGGMPIGYASDIKLSCKDLGLDMPDDSSTPTNYMKVLANMIDFLKCQDENVNVLPPIFTMPDKVTPINNFICMLCSKAVEEEALFRVYKLNTLFFTLINEIKSLSNEGFPQPSLALRQLKKDLFRYNPGLGCMLHEERDKSTECTQSRAKRWAYTILDSCCPLVGIPMVPGKHVPADFDMDVILALTEQKNERPLSSGVTVSSACGSQSSLQDTFNDVLTFNTTSTVPEAAPSTSSMPFQKPPPRMYKTVNNSYVLQMAPKMDDDNFPALGTTRGRGVGRGRRNNEN